MSKRFKTGIALGGGGARGLAHIGVLKVLERESIPIDLIAGTSMGALVGAAYAVGQDAVGLESQVLDFIFSQKGQNTGFRRLEKVHPFNTEKVDTWHRIVRIAEKHLFLSLAILRKAMLSEEEMKEILACFLPDMDIRDTTIPLAVAAVDLISGREVLLKEGPLISAVMASCAVPGFMPPVPWDGMILVDGSVINAVPASPAKRAGADVVIGVDVGYCLCRVPPIEDGIDVINRATEIMSFYLNQERRQGADILIEPAVQQFDWTDFPKYHAIVGEGEKAVEAKIEEIRDLVGRSFRKIASQRVVRMLSAIKKQDHGEKWNDKKGCFRGQNEGM